MLKAVIDNIDVYLSTLGLKTEGLAEKVDFNGEDMPCVYLTGKEYKPINPEVSTIYHRIISGPSRTTEESPVYDDEIQTLRWSMRAVAIFENGIYGEDINGIEDKVIQNIMAAMYDASAVDGVAKALGLSILSYSPNDSNRGREAWRAEFSTPWTGWRRIVAVDYDLTLQAFESCFIAQGCDDEEIDIIQIIIGEYCEGGTCADGSVTLNAVAFGTVPSGGTLAGLVQYVSGTSVGSLLGAIWTIPDPVCDPATITVNTQAYSSVVSGGSDDIPVVNSEGANIGTVSPGGNVTIGDSEVAINGVPFAVSPAEIDLNIRVQYPGGANVGSREDTSIGPRWRIPDPVCDPATITVNGTAYSSVPSGGSDDIQVVNSQPALVGTVSPGGNVTIDDSIISINSVFHRALRATDPYNVIIYNSGFIEIGFVNPSWVTIRDMTIDYPDGTTEAVVVVPEGTIVTAPRWSIQLSGAVASPVTVTAPAWDSSFVCSAQTATGGTITQITVNGGAPVASLVGVAIPASAVLVFTFTGSLTQILLSF